MRLIPSDPDIETVLRRIDDGSLDLRPEFQRGEVWSRPKQRLLIDSILRDWYVPPIHVIRTEEDEQEVLDGQQRLRAIHEFAKGHLTVDGEAEPKSAFIFELGGLHYSQLPPQVRRRFDRFTLRVFEVVDYAPEEPYELFYRLNQPTTLTSAEKRNAFFGPTRDQVRQITVDAERAGMQVERIGFSNARMAYEDIVARFLWTLEMGTLREKVTATRVTERYRSERPFSPPVVSWATASMQTLFGLPSLASSDIRLNKATAYSWLCFVARSHRHAVNLEQSLDSFLKQTELLRLRMKSSPANEYASGDKLQVLLVPIFNDRATARVNDVSSVLLRDAILWLLYGRWDSHLPFTELGELRRSTSTAESVGEAEVRLLTAAERTRWGDLV